MTKEWILDSGATTHIARSDQKFTDEVPISQEVETASRSSMMAVGLGPVVLNTREGEIGVMPSANATKRWKADTTAVS